LIAITVLAISKVRYGFIAGGHGRVSALLLCRSRQM